MKLENRKEKLIKVVQTYLPEFVKACEEPGNPVIFHQDAFATNFELNEYKLLGQAVKYAGLKGKNITIVTTPKIEDADVARKGPADRSFE